MPHSAISGGGPAGVAAAWGLGAADGAGAELPPMLAHPAKIAASSALHVLPRYSRFFDVNLMGSLISSTETSLRLAAR